MEKLRRKQFDEDPLQKEESHKNSSKGEGSHHEQGGNEPKPKQTTREQLLNERNLKHKAKGLIKKKQPHQTAKTIEDAAENTEEAKLKRKQIIEEELALLKAK